MPSTCDFQGVECFGARFVNNDIKHFKRSFIIKMTQVTILCQRILGGGGGGCNVLELNLLTMISNILKVLLE